MGKTLTDCFAESLNLPKSIFPEQNFQTDLPSILKEPISKQKTRKINSYLAV